MGKRVCPWWLGYVLASPLRRLTTNPAKLLAPYVREGMTVLEPGPGMGFFTLELARLVGASGRVIAVDVQEKMLARLRRRARKAGLDGRIEARLAPPESMQLEDLAGKVDFTLAYAVVHEFPSAERFFSEVSLASKLEATLLLVEPTGHVTQREFDAEMETARAAGFVLRAYPSISQNHSALLLKVKGVSGTHTELKSETGATR